jgi:hypothetical protein
VGVVVEISQAHSASDDIQMIEVAVIFVLAASSISTMACNTVMYSQSFTSSLIPATQCLVWRSFVAQLTVRSYTLLTMRGTFDPIGVTITDPSTIANIALALRTSTSFGPVTSNYRSWVVGPCENGPELSASGTICSCINPGYSLRPCIGNLNYGGINSSTCSGPTQTMTVIFQY